MKELEIAEVLKSNVDVLNDIEKSQTYDVYDYYNDVCLIEIKGRHNTKRFPDAIIEQSKYTRLLKECGGDRHCLYVMNSGRDIYVFDLKQLTRDEYDFGWCERGGLPTTTFWNNERTSKNVGYLQWDAAMKVLKYNTKTKKYSLMKTE